MLQSEIDDISNAFYEAWKDYFGQDIYYIRLLNDFTISDELYGESKKKVYDSLNKVKLCGSIKFRPSVEEIELAGLDVNIDAILTCVTKELEDNDIPELDMNSLIEIPKRNGESVIFNITDYVTKVQFKDNYVFTKIGVSKYGDAINW